jgi:tetratricopeptide (TPR) repeat protein
MPSQEELFSGPESSTGNWPLNKSITFLVLALLVKSAFGFGQQQRANEFESLVTAAQKAQAGHDLGAAVNDYKQAVRIRADMPELWANLGLLQHQVEDYPGAILSFQQANRLNPNLYVPNLFLGIGYARMGKAPEAIPFLVKAGKINKTDPQAPLALGRAYFATGNFSAAAREFEHAARLDPKLGAAWFDLGISRLKQVEVDSRRMSLEDKDSPFAGALYAESLTKQARFNEAAALYRSLLTSRSQPPCLHSALGLALLRHRDVKGATAEFATERDGHPECSLAFFGQARIAIDRGDNEAAVKLLQELWRRDHGFFVSNAAVLVDGTPDDAASAFAAYLSQHTAIIPADLLEALLAALNVNGLVLDGQHDRINRSQPGAFAAPASKVQHAAEEYYAAGEFGQCAQRLDPVLIARNADKLRLLAACSYLAGDNERTIGAATAIGVLKPHSDEALYWSIKANERLALQSLTRFQQLESDSARSHVLLGDIYDQLERFDDAQAEYNKALAIAPGDPAAMLGLASTYLSNNNIEKAMETARAALDRSPQDPELNLIVAESLVATHQFADAEPYLMKSLNVRPQMLGHLHALLGKVYAETGRTKDAIDQLKMSVTSDEDGSIHYLLARLYRQIGDTKDESAALDQVKKIKQQRFGGGVKTIEDPDLSSLESPSGGVSMQ